jgi:hypothetical protein
MRATSGRDLLRPFTHWVAWPGARQSLCFRGGTKTPVPKIYAMRAIVAGRSVTQNLNAGWELRCGDDGSKRSRGTLPSPSKPSC